MFLYEADYIFKTLFFEIWKFEMSLLNGYKIVTENKNIFMKYDFYVR